MVSHPRIPEIPYLITLTRAGSGRVEVWPLGLQEPLPTIPIPLRAPDPDIPLNLSEALAAIYEEAAYDLSIDYTQPPPPPVLPETDVRWIKTLLA